ncbi:CHASE2 domain-containing protein [Chloroflexota bacterium]
MVKSRRRRRYLLGLLTGAVIGAVLCAAFCFNLFSGIQLQSSDFLFKAAGAHQSSAQDGDVMIVAIDEKSLDQLGHFPSWPRSYYAQVVDRLAEAEARIVVLDVLFAEPAPCDEQLAESIESAGNVILPLAYSSSLHEYAGAGEPAGGGGFIRPVSLIEQNALAVGHAGMLPDEDGVVRRLPIAIHSGEDFEPALALAAVAKYLRRPQVIESTVENNSLSFAGRSIPLDDADGMIINYTGTSTERGNLAGFQTVPFVDTLRGEIDKPLFRDKIVIIGATAAALGDTFWTPTGRMMNGVEIHANAIHTILNADFLRSSPSSVTIALIMVLAVLCALIVLRLRVLWAALSATLLLIVYFLTAFTFFDKGIMLNILYPPMAILGAFVGVNLFNIASERSDKRLITETFGRYISPPVVDKILTALDTDEIKPGGQQQEVTVAFADIRGFTNMSEEMQPEALVRVLNLYLSIAIDAVIKQGGIVNKFAGDSVLAIWNAPVLCEEHALMATKAAIDIQRSIEELQQRETDLPKVNFGIGISTGKVVAGNMGSENRLEYSVVGDAVNIAARLTSAAEGGKVWVSCDTYELIKDHVAATPLEPLTVKGKREPIKAYEVLNIQEELFGLKSLGTRET